MKFPDRLKRLMAEADMTPKELAERVPCSVQAVYTWLSGHKNPQRKINALAKALGVPAEALMDRPAVVVVDPDAPPNGYAMIPEFELRLKAGEGAEPEWEEVHGARPYPLPIDFFHKHQTTPGKVRCARIAGDSMEPTVRDGDLAIWISEPCPEVGCVQIRDGRVYVVAVDGSMRIKRLSRIKDGIRVVSDNEHRYLPEDYLRDECDRLRIYGRVVMLVHDGDDL